MRHGISTFMLCVAIAACGDGAGPSGVRMEFDPRHVTDTIQAPTPTPLHIRIRDGDKPFANASVDVFGTGVLVSSTPASPYGSPTTTDAQGTLTVYVFMLTQAVEGYVHVRTGEHRDSIPVSVLPGAATGAAFAVSDTALAPGQGFTVELRRTDRLGNLRSETVPPTSLTSSSTHVATLAGSTLNAVAPGATTLHAATSFGPASTRVFVLPDAVLATQPGPVLRNSFGQQVGTLPAADLSVCSSWHPDGRHLLMSGLRTVTPGGAVATIPLSDPAVVPRCGEYSANGEWIVFEGRLVTEPEGASSVWRMRSDGTELARITTPPAGEVHYSASPSPDGSRVVYTQSTGSWSLVVVDVATGARDTIVANTPPASARWSPSGQWIAYTYWNGDAYRVVHTHRFGLSLRLVRPDGTEDHVPGGGAVDTRFWSNPRWSPDGEWLVGNEFSGSWRFKFIRPSTGEALLAPAITGEYWQPAWRP